MGKRPKKAAKPMKPKKSGSPKKPKKSSSGVLTALAFLICVCLIDLFLILYVYRIDLSQKKITLEAELRDVESQEMIIREKIARIPVLDQEKTDYLAVLRPSMELYYGDYQQEKMIYNVANMFENSGIAFDSLTFAKAGMLSAAGLENAYTESLQTNTPTPEAPAEGGEAPPVEGGEAPAEGAVPPPTAPPVTQEAVDMGMQMQFELVTLSFKYTSKYSELKKFLSEIDRNDKKLLVRSISLEKVFPSTFEDIDPAHIDTDELFAVVEETNQIAFHISGFQPRPLDTTAGGYDAETGQISTEQLASAIEQILGEEELRDFKLNGVTGNIEISFVSVPSISKGEYITEEDNEEALSHITNRNNPLDHSDFLAPITPKTDIFEFRNGGAFDKLLSPTVTDLHVSVNSEEDGLAVKYNFDDTVENPKILINMANKNVVINQPINSIGMEIHSDAATEAKIYFRIVDSTGRPETVLLTSGIGWRGIASVDTRLPAGLAYPVRIDGIYINQTGKEKYLDSSTLKFLKIYTSEARIIPETPETEQPPTQP